MALEPDDFSDMVQHWSRLTPQQRAATVRRLVARSRDGDAVTDRMVELLALVRQAGSRRDTRVASRRIGRPPAPPRP